MNACILEVPAAATKSIENDPDVDYVELDMEVHAYNPVWGLDRIDQVSLYTIPSAWAGGLDCWVLLLFCA